MLAETAAIRTYFGKLGLRAEIADIYIALYSHGPQTISALSRTAGVERTRIYRLIDELLDSQLIELETHSKRGVIKAAPIANLRILINRRDQELKNLGDELELVEQVMARNNLSSQVTAVQLTSGLQHVRELLMQIAREVAETHQGFIACNLKALGILVGSDFVTQWLGVLSAAGVEYGQIEAPNAAVWFTYGKSVVYVQKRQDEMFATSIANAAIADTHRQLFALMTKS